MTDSVAGTRKVGGSALTTPHFLLLYSAMLVAAAGNTALQSVMPAIGRATGIADLWVAIAYTWSAVLWVWLAPFWAEKSDHHGRKGEQGEEFTVHSRKLRRGLRTVSWLERRAARRHAAAL